MKFAQASLECVCLLEHTNFSSRGSSKGSNTRGRMGSHRRQQPESDGEKDSTKRRRLAQLQSDESASGSDEEWQSVEDEQQAEDIVEIHSTGRAHDEGLAENGEKELRDCNVRPTETDCGHVCRPTETDCGDVYTSARSAAEASFFRGARKRARPHQAEAVAKLLSLIWLDRRAAQTRPINYLIQHATGTGKSLTIAALTLSLLSFTTNGAFRAVALEDCACDEEDEGINDDRAGGDGQAHGGGGAGESFFSMVIVLTDRLQLDRQLGDTVEKMLNAHGERLVRCSTSAQLRDLLLAPAHRRPRAILSTLQKFAGLSKGCMSLGDGASAAPASASSPLHQLLGGGRTGGRIALIADEAHRSHGAGTSLAINQLLGGRAGQSNRMTYFGFSATPSHAALRLFGVNRRGSNGPEFAPAHCYSLQEAIRDGLVCDVLAHYTCIHPRFARARSSSKAIHHQHYKEGKKRARTNSIRADDAGVAGGGGGGRGAGALSDSEVIEYKAWVIARHFSRALAAAQLPQAQTGTGGARGDGGEEGSGDGFRPRGMLVCRSRADVVAYTHALRRLVSTRGGDPQTSGGEGLEGAAWSRQQLARVVGVGGEEDERWDWDWSVYGAFSGEVALPEGCRETESGLNGPSSLLDTAELLVVCNKLETGFDEPRIAAMYIDRPISGARWSDLRVCRVWDSTLCISHDLWRMQSLSLSLSLSVCLSLSLSVYVWSCVGHALVLSFVLRLSCVSIRVSRICPDCLASV
jgi:hypothetical protein